MNSNYDWNQEPPRKNKGEGATILKLLLIFIITILIVFIFFNILTAHKRDGRDGIFSRINVYFRSLMGNLDKTIEFENNTIIAEGKTKVVDKTNLNPSEYIPTKKVGDIYIPLEGKHYYNNLDENGQIIYTKLKSESAYFLDGFHEFDFGYVFSDFLAKGGEESLKKSFQYAVNAFLFDYPEIFFINVEHLSLAITTLNFSKENKVYSVKIINTDGLPYYSKEFKSKEDVLLAKNALETKKNKIISKVKGRSDFEKVKFIHDYLVSTVEYDTTYKRENIYNVYGALHSKYAVCEGYTKAFKYLLDAADVKTIIVAGQTTKGLNEQDGERHAWNIVKLDGKWYGVDVTWDDPVMLSGLKPSYEHTQKYFLKGSDTFNRTHIADGNIVEDANIKYPKLEESDYGR